MRDLVRDVAAHLNEPVKEEIMELEEMLAQKKLEEGRAEGRAEGRTAVLLKQFQLKFGTVPPGIEDRVRAATDEEIDRWTERILTAASLEDVLG